MNQRTPAVQPTQPARGRLRALWLGTAARYTVIALGALLINALLHDSPATTYVDTLRFFLFLPFSVLLTLAAWVRRGDKPSLGARVCLHALLTLGGFYLCLYLPYQVKSRPSGEQVLMLVLLAVVLYAIALVIYLLCTHRAREAAREAAPYESQFKHRND